MKPIPDRLETDEQKEQAKAAFKAAGYGHFSTCYAGSVTNMKRGIRISWSLDSGNSFKWKTLWIEIRKEKTENVWTGRGKTDSVTTTEYRREGPDFVLKGHQTAGKNETVCDDVQSLVESAVRYADSCTGDKSITKASLKKGLLQNMLLEELKTKLEKQYKEWKGFGVAFNMKAQSVNSASSMRISIPHQSNNDKGTYPIEDLSLSLSDGKIAINFGDTHAYSTEEREKAKIQVAIPVFADPAFNPDHLFTFAVKAIGRMDGVRDVCATKQREIDRLNEEIRQAKSETRRDFAAYWQETWYGDLPGEGDRQQEGKEEQTHE